MCLPVTLPVIQSHAAPIVFVVCGAWLQFQSIAAAAVIPSALTVSLMAPKRKASGKYARGSRTRAAGFKGRSGWPTSTVDLDTASEDACTVMVTVLDVATSKLKDDAEQHGTPNT